MHGFQLLFCLLRAWFVSQTRLALENLALRQQLARYKQNDQEIVGNVGISAANLLKTSTTDGYPIPLVTTIQSPVLLF